MTTVNVLEAKTRFSQLLAQAENGEEVIVARAGHPVVKLVPVNQTPPRTFGQGFDGIAIGLPDSAFFDPLPETELAAWEGASGNGMLER